MLLLLWCLPMIQRWLQRCTELPPWPQLNRLTEWGIQELRSLLPAYDGGFWALLIILPTIVLVGSREGGCTAVAVAGKEVVRLWALPCEGCRAQGPGVSVDQGALFMTRGVRHTPCAAGAAVSGPLPIRGQRCAPHVDAHSADGVREPGRPPTERERATERERERERERRCHCHCRLVVAVGAAQLLLSVASCCHWPLPRVKGQAPVSQGLSAGTQIMLPGAPWSAMDITQSPVLPIFPLQHHYVLWLDDPSAHPAHVLERGGCWQATAG